MHKLAKYLKPFSGLILASIVLLYIQAMTDLSLPDYMSNIVNVGIQQGGIQKPVPEVIRESQMNKVLMFAEKDYKSVIKDSYRLINKDSSDYTVLLKKYPLLSTESLYVLEDKNIVDKLSLPMGKALLAVAYTDKLRQESMDKGKKNPASPAKGAESTSKAQGDPSLLKALGDDMLIQGATPLVKAEYEAIGIDTGKIQNSYIINTGLIMLLISLLSALCIVIVGFLSSKVAAGISKKLRRDVFTRVSSFSNTEMDKFSTASLITRTTNDVTQIQMLVVMMIRMVFYAPIIGVGGIIKAINRSPSMSWIIAVAVIALLTLITSVFIVALPKFKAIQKLTDKLNLVTRENLTGMMVIRAFNTQKFEEDRFDKANKDLTDINLFVNRVMVLMFPTMMLLMNGVTLLVIWIGAHQIAQSSMQVGDMMAFMQYAMQIIFAFLMMSFMFIMIPRASVASQRIAEVLETHPSIDDPKNPKLFPKTSKGIVEFEKVSFRYEGASEDMLKNISFTAMPGMTTAFIGSTGSGKTTLVNLIPRFYDVTKGKILIDGIDIRELPLYNLRDIIGYVPQKSSLFSGTIASNIKYAKENASHEELSKICEISQAMDFINEKSEGFNAPISQGGTNVSGGQKQRLSIARALMKKSHVYIFDDSFSALDFKTDSSLRNALKENIKDSTLIIIAQRISTIMNADQIIVLDEGKIVGIGKHEELMKNCITYQEIALSQLSKEELA